MAWFLVPWKVNLIFLGFDAFGYPFSKVVDKYPISGIGVYACYGKAAEELDFCTIDIIWTKKISLLLDPRSLN